MPGPRALALLHLGDDLLAGAADAAQLVELGVDAVAGEAAVARQRRRLVDERRFDPVAHVHEIVELRRAASGPAAPAGPPARSAGAGMTASECFRPTRSRGPGGAERGARDQPLEILDRLDRVAELAALGVAKRQLLDGVEAIANRLERDQRAEQPRPQQPAADRRHRSIELVEQRSGRGRPRIPRRSPGASASSDRSAARRRAGDRRSTARERDRPSASRAGDGRARRPRRWPPDGRRGRILRGLPRAADRAACAAPPSSSNDQSVDRASIGRPEATTGGIAVAGAAVLADGTTISRGRARRARRRAPACRRRPAYSAALNSPVDRSSSATPIRQPARLRELTAAAFVPGAGTPPS